MTYIREQRPPKTMLTYDSIYTILNINQHNLDAISTRFVELYTIFTLQMYMTHIQNKNLQMLTL